MASRALNALLALTPNDNDDLLQKPIRQNQLLSGIPSADRNQFITYSCVVLEWQRWA